MGKLKTEKDLMEHDNRQRRFACSLLMRELGRVRQELALYEQVAADLHCDATLKIIQRAIKTLTQRRNAIERDIKVLGEGQSSEQASTTHELGVAP